MTLVAVILIDALLVQWIPWEAIGDRSARRGWKLLGIAEDQESLRSVAAASPERQDVVVVGSSRARKGFELSVAAEMDPERAYSRITHAGIQIYEILAFSYQLSDHSVDWIVLPLSEFDLYRPLVLRSVTGAGSLRAAAFLTTRLDLGTVLHQRADLLRLYATGTMASYRFRRTLQEAGLDKLRRAPGVKRDPGSNRTRMGPIVEGGQPFIDSAAMERLRRRLSKMRPEIPQSVVIAETRQLASVTAGRHVTINRELLERAIEVLTRAGSRVLIAETPVDPIADRLRDPQLAEAFRAYAGELADNPSVEFLPLSAHRPFQKVAFTDLTHLEPEHGAPRFTRVIVRHLRQSALRRRAAN